MSPGITSMFTARRRDSTGAPAEPLWFEWLALAGLFVFAAWLLGARGVWSLLLNSDPTGITVATLWSGMRALELTRERSAAQARLPGWAASYWAEIGRAHV